MDHHAGGQVAVNGTTDTTTANVTELAYVNGKVWQENASNLWWGKDQPHRRLGARLPGTATSPLPTVTITRQPDQRHDSLSQVSITATSGNHMVFISGTGDIVNLSGGDQHDHRHRQQQHLCHPGRRQGFDHVAPPTC